MIPTNPTVNNPWTLLVCAPLVCWFGWLFATGPSVPLGGVKAPRPAAADYVSLLKQSAAWTRFPLRVYFIRDENYSASRVQFARYGFNRWVVATEGFVSYVETDDIDQADVTVRFEPKTANGNTRTRFDHGRMVRADAMIGVRDRNEIDVEAISAHEYGHALGIDGHSDNPSDLMYPFHVAGVQGRITDRDLNTMAARYPPLAKLLAARHPNPKRADPASRSKTL